MACIMRGIVLFSLVFAATGECINWLLYKYIKERRLHNTISHISPIYIPPCVNGPLVGSGPRTLVGPR